MKVSSHWSCNFLGFGTDRRRKEAAGFPIPCRGEDADRDTRSPFPGPVRSLPVGPLRVPRPYTGIRVLNG